MGIRGEAKESRRIEDCLSSSGSRGNCVYLVSKETGTAGEMRTGERWCAHVDVFVKAGGGRPFIRQQIC